MESGHKTTKILKEPISLSKKNILKGHSRFFEMFFL